MGLADLRATLFRHHRLRLTPTHLSIYHIDGNPKYVPLTRVLFSWLEERHSTAATSALTMAELLVQPYIQQDQQRADSFFGLLSSQTRLTWIPVDLPVADATARLRAKYRLKTPDAVQAATTIIGGATALITNDRIFERVTEFETIVLDQYL